MIAPAPTKEGPNKAGCDIAYGQPTISALTVARAYIEADLAVLIDCYSTGGEFVEAKLSVDERMHVAQARYAIARIDAAFAAAAKSAARI